MMRQHNRFTRRRNKEALFWSRGFKPRKLQRARTHCLRRRKGRGLEIVGEDGEELGDLVVDAQSRSRRGGGAMGDRRENSTTKGKKWSFADSVEEQSTNRWASRGRAPGRPRGRGRPHGRGRGRSTMAAEDGPPAANTRSRQSFRRKSRREGKVYPREVFNPVVLKIEGMRYE